MPCWSQAGMEQQVGAPADLVARGDDLVEATPEDVTDLPVQLTVVAGRVVHQRD